MNRMWPEPEAIVVSREASDEWLQLVSEPEDCDSSKVSFLIRWVWYCHEPDKGFLDSELFISFSFCLSEGFWSVGQKTALEKFTRVQMQFSKWKKIADIKLHFFLFLFSINLFGLCLNGVTQNTWQNDFDFGNGISDCRSRARIESIINRSLVSDDIKAPWNCHQKNLMVVKINTAFSSRKRRDSVLPFECLSVCFSKLTV